MVKSPVAPPPGAHGNGSLFTPKWAKKIVLLDLVSVSFCWANALGEHWFIFCAVMALKYLFGLCGCQIFSWSHLGLVDWDANFSLEKALNGGSSCFGFLSFFPYFFLTFRPQIDLRLLFLVENNIPRVWINSIHVVINVLNNCNID